MYVTDNLKLYKHIIHVEQNKMKISNGMSQTTWLNSRTWRNSNYCVVVRLVISEFQVRHPNQSTKLPNMFSHKPVHKVVKKNPSDFQVTFRLPFWKVSSEWYSLMGSLAKQTNKPQHLDEWHGLVLTWVCWSTSGSPMYCNSVAPDEPTLPAADNNLPLD